MCNLLLVFSKYEKELVDCHQFNFHGYYAGQKIKNIHIGKDRNINLEVDNIYLLWTQMITINKGILGLKLIKYKKIS